MTHPQLDQAVQKVDQFLGAYLPASAHDRLRDLEKSTGQPKAYFAFAFAAVISSLIYAMGGMKLVSDLIAFVYPAYMSFKAVESAETTDDTQWLTYWVVFSVFSIVENITAFFVSWIPFYYFIKIGFFMWLYHPKFCGAGLVYKQVVKKYVIPHMKALEQASEPPKKAE